VKARVGEKVAMLADDGHYVSGEIMSFKYETGNNGEKEWYAVMYEGCFEVENLHYNVTLIERQIYDKYWKKSSV